MTKKNKEIEDFIKEKDSKRESYTAADTAYISEYTGNGGRKGSGVGTLYQYYTPGWICQIMRDLAYFHGYGGGTILDPSIGTGNIVAPFPDQGVVTGFEPDSTSSRIAGIRLPKASIHPLHFETAFLQPLSEGIYGSLLKGKTTWLRGYPFELVITNPPYGEYHNFYSGRLKPLFHKVRFTQMEMAFMLLGLLMLRPGGLLIYITSQNFMRNGLKYAPMKQVLGQYADLLDAYRLPPLFPRTKVCPDILIFKRK